MPQLAETHHQLSRTLYPELALEHQDAMRVTAEYYGKAERFE